MSLDNRYIFSGEQRKVLFRICFASFYISIFFVVCMLFMVKYGVIGIFTAYSLPSIGFLISFAFFVLANLEYARQRYYTLLIITFSIFLVFTLSILLVEIIFDEHITVTGARVNNDDRKIYLNVAMFLLISSIVVLFLLALDIFVTTVLFRYAEKLSNFKVDAVSDHFAVDVLIYTTYIGTLFGTFFYCFFCSEENKVSFFSGVNVTHIALASVGLVTFFWAAKSAKNKSIELDITRSRESGRLFSEGSVFLNAPHNDKKYIGLSYLNMIAGQSEGPLQKEAIDLMADFILNANDITTANKPRIRAMEYLSDRLKTDFLDDDIDQLIKLSSSELVESNENYNFTRLNVVYENFHFSNDKKYLRYKLLEENEIIKKNNERMKGLIGYNNCNFENYSGQNGIEKITLVYAQNCSFKKCKIGVVKGYSKKSETLLNGGQEGEFAPLNNKFEQCDFSDCDGWNILRPSNRMEGGNAETIAENAFINCFYYSGHEPKGFVKERDGALLAEITSKEQFEEMIGSSLFMQYAPPDD